MKLRIYHTVNAGLYIWNGKTGLMIDILHGGREEGFSDMPVKYRDMMLKKRSFFRYTNDLLFTHAHADHYSEELVKDFMSVNPDCMIYGPMVSESNQKPVMVEPGVSFLQVRDYQVYIFTTVHDGKRFESCPHESLLVKSGEDTVWISGDAAYDGELAKKVMKYVKDTSVDVAFANVFQIRSKNNLEFLLGIAPNELYLYHLSYVKDDEKELYHRLAKSSIERCERMGIEVHALKHDSFMERDIL